MRKYRVALEKEDREELGGTTQKENLTSQEMLNTLALLNGDQVRFRGRPMKNRDVVSVLRISTPKIDRGRGGLLKKGLGVSSRDAKENGCMGGRPATALKHMWWRYLRRAPRRGG
jgi:hypothetical protein